MNMEQLEADIERLSKVADGYDGGWELFALVDLRRRLKEEERRRAL
jgi:hypothetical protein